MAAISTLRLYIEPEVPGCLNRLIDRAIVQAAREFCNRTRIWKEGSSVSVAVTGVNVPFDVPVSDSEIITVDYLLHNGIELIPITEFELSAADPYWRNDESITPTHYVTKINEKEALLYPKLTAGVSDTVTYEVTLRPSMDATELPDFMTQDFLDAIIDGALERLLNMRKMPWADPEEAARRGTMFKREIYRAKHIVQIGLSTTDQSVRRGTLA